MEQERRTQGNRAAAVRKGDQGSYTALRWVSTLFKSAAVFLAVAILAEFIAGIRAEGWGIMPILLGEVARATFLAILLWAGGDLVRLLLQIGRDLRAERVLLARIAHRRGVAGLEAAAPASQVDGLASGVLEVGGAGESAPEPAGETGAAWGRGAVTDSGAEGAKPGEAAA